MSEIHRESGEGFARRRTSRPICHVAIIRARMPANESPGREAGPAEARDGDLHELARCEPPPRPPDARLRLTVPLCFPQPRGRADEL